MKEKQIVYKLVVHYPEEALYSDKLTSVIVKAMARNVYTPGKWCRTQRWLARQGYYITAFSKLEDARAFYKAEYFEVRVHSDGVVEIWRAEATSVISILPTYASTYMLGQGTINHAEGRWWEWPTGIIMCKTIKLLEKVVRDA